MAVGSEARVPFLDHKFLELVMSIPKSEIQKLNIYSEEGGRGMPDS
jgi:asparagine synthetase B (glutamine-hydrolysing)